MSETIRCRARLDNQCYDGSSMSRQMPGEDSPVQMSEDGTFDGESIVCDACYLQLMPLTRSGAATNDEIPGAISLYRQNVEFLSKQEDPSKFVEQAQQAVDTARTGSPYWASAKLMLRLAQSEVERRQVAA